MLENIKTRLKEFGLDDLNEILITSCIARVEEYIKIYCNIAEIPSEIENIEIDLVCAEYINTLNMTGQLDDFVFPVKSITEGDTSITLTSSNNGIDGLVSYLNKGKEVLLCYRKIRW